MSEFSVSQMYDGGGTANALQAAVDLDAVVALATQPTAIATGNYTGIELFLSVAADDKSPVVVAINHSSSTIALTNIIHIQEDVVSAADMAFKVDRSVWSLTAATDHEPKRLIYFPVAPDSYVSIVCQSLDSSAVYCKYRLTQMHTAVAGGVGAAEGDTATAHGAPTANTQRVVQAVDVDLGSNLPDQSVKHTHTTAGAGEEISGDTAFTAAAVVCVRGVDTWVAVGDTELQAEGQDIKYGANVPFLVKLAAAATTFWLDAATGGEVSIHQVS